MKTTKITDMLVLDELWSQGYGMVPRYVMRNPRLSIDAKAIYAYLCSADGGRHTCTVDTIKTDLNIDDTRFARAFDELRTYLNNEGHPLTIQRMVA